MFHLLFRNVGFFVLKLWDPIIYIHTLYSLVYLYSFVTLWHKK